jgi:hypothetical protein
MYDNMKENGTLEPKRKPEDFGPGDGPKWLDILNNMY